ncbi:MAG: histidinol-phosphatase HisJ family protein [Halanaerobium sp.]|nr:histidinol-phosphatase HisJ family protein [Halanaerobium sp.]
MKNIFDCHVHSYFSEDSELSMAEAILYAMEKGLGGLAFTDHVDLGYPYAEDYPVLDYEEYTRQIRKLQRKVYPGFKVLTGIELGLQHDNLQDNQAFMRDKDFDFVIGSIHSIDGEPLAEGDVFQTRDIDDVFSRFLQYTYEVISNYSNFDVLGHLDIIRRYSGNLEHNLSIDKHQELVDAILKALIDKGKGIEVNTSGIRYGLNSFHPEFWVLQRYNQLGGKVVTIGSDAHRLEGIGTYFKQGIEMINQAGFKYITYFKKREPEFLPISKVG